MRVISFLNLKGGVGKTVTVVNTAAILSKLHHKKVLVVDADSQCNATEFFGAAAEKQFNLAMALQDQTGSVETTFFCITASNYRNVRIIPASDQLMDLDLTKLGEKRLYGDCLVDLREAYLTAGPYADPPDVILIDCPPAFNAASTAALLASDEVVIPIKLDAFSLRGMANLTKQIENMRQINPHLRLSGLLPTMWYKSDKIKEAEEILKKSGLPVYAHIRRTPKVDEMTFAGKPLIETSPRSAATIDYRRFVTQLMTGKGGRRNG